MCRSNVSSICVVGVVVGDAGEVPSGPSVASVGGDGVISVCINVVRILVLDFGPNLGGVNGVMGQVLTSVFRFDLRTSFRLRFRAKRI